MSQMGNKSVAFNAVIITAQRIASAVLGLVTTPIILSVLGVEDYGLFTLIVGFVASLAFVNWSLSLTTQRYVAFAVGEGNIENQKKAFNNAMIIHIVYAAIICLAILLFGVYFIDSLLNIPVGKETVAKNLMFIVSGTTFLSIVSVPYQGVLRAVENFVLYALLNLLGSVLKLGIAVALLFLPASIEKLEVYSSLLMVSALLVLIVSITTCSRKHPIARLSFSYYDPSVLKNMVSFMGWNLLGSLAILSRNQGVSVLLNIFFGVIVNAAYGIAMQINSAMGLLTQGITGAITPKILKGAGSGDKEEMVRRMIQMTKWGIIFSSFFALVFLNQAQFLLSMWLKVVPEGAVVFSQLIILFSISTSLSGGLQTIFNAIGKVRAYNIFVSTVLLLNLPIAYLLFSWGYESYTIMIVAIGLELLAMMVRLVLLKRYVDYSILSYLFEVLVKTLLPTVAVFILLDRLSDVVDNPYSQFLFTVLGAGLVQSTVVYLLMLDKEEKQQVGLLLRRFKTKNS